MSRGVSIIHFLAPAALALTAGAAGCTTVDDDELELGGAEQALSSGKRTICHYDGQGRAREITISENAVAVHVANHGDHDLISFYADGDGDGYGAGDAILACTQPAGTSTNADDCNDGDAAVNPGAAEVCGDNTDNDCDGEYAQAQAVQFLSFQPQRFDFPQGVCTTHQDVTHLICRERPDQQILAAGNATATARAYWDEMGIFAVTAPDGTTSGHNFIFFEPNCRDQSYGSTNVNPGGNATVDITSLFGDQYGIFSVNLKVRNAFQPYSWEETWVVPVN